MQIHEPSGFLLLLLFLLNNIKYFGRVLQSLNLQHHVYITTSEPPLCSVAYQCLVYEWKNTRSKNCLNDSVIMVSGLIVEWSGNSDEVK